MSCLGIFGTWLTRCGGGREGSGRKEDGGRGKRKLGGGVVPRESLRKVMGGLNALY